LAPDAIDACRKIMENLLLGNLPKRSTVYVPIRCYGKSPKQNFTERTFAEVKNCRIYLKDLT